MECLIDLNLIIKAKNDILVPTYYMNRNVDNILKTEWVSDWSGHEFHAKLKLSSALNRNIFFELIKSFYDTEKTHLIWKNGIFNKDASCDILFTHSDDQNGISIFLSLVNKLKKF